MWRKGNPHTLLVGIQTAAATMEKRMEITQKIKYKNTIRSSYSTSGYLSEEYEVSNSKNVCAPMFFTALFTIVNTGKQLKYLSMDE